MKKFVVGLITGMLLMTAGSVFADEVKSLIGRQIQGQFPVSVDGERLPIPAIVVDGTSYLPVRSFAESIGYDVYFDPEGAIRLELKQELQLFSSEEREELQRKIKNEQINMDVDVRQLEYVRERITGLSKGKVDMRQSFLDTGFSEDDPIVVERLGAYDIEINKFITEEEQLQDKISQYEARIAELEAQLQAP